MTMWLAAAGGVAIFILGLAAGGYYPVVNFLWLIYTLGMVAIVFMWTKHITGKLGNLLLETPDEKLSQKQFSIGVREFKTVDKILGRIQHKLQVAEFTMLNQKARQAGENFKLMISSTTDPLTGIPNRTEMDKQLEKRVGRVEPLAVIMTDIDHFKKVNDTYGHQAGDMVLRQFALTVKKNVRPADFVARYGGEEFLVICNAGREETLEIAERVRQAVETEKVVLPEGQEVSITASFGVGICRSGDSVRTLVERADSALYNAKQSGRNVVKEESGDN